MQCGTCFKTFTSSIALSQHRMISHPTICELDKCDICPRNSKSKSGKTQAKVSSEKKDDADLNTRKQINFDVFEDKVDVSKGEIVDADINTPTQSNTRKRVKFDVFENNVDETKKTDGNLWWTIAFKVWDEFKSTEGANETSHFFRNKYLNQRYLELFEEEFKRWENAIANDETLRQIKDKATAMMKDNQNISINDALQIAIRHHKINILGKIAWIDIERKKGNRNTFY